MVDYSAVLPSMGVALGIHSLLNEGQYTGDGDAVGQLIKSTATLVASVEASTTSSSLTDVIKKDAILFKASNVAISVGVKASVLFKVGYYVNNTSYPGDVAVIVKLIKSDGSTESELASKTVLSVSNITDTTEVTKLAGCEIEAEADLSANEYLILRIIVQADNPDGDTTYVKLYHDPAGGDPVRINALISVYKSLTG